MPQMAPYNWFNLFTMFNLIVIYMITYIYYLNFNTTDYFKTITPLILKSNYTWKW